VAQEALKTVAARLDTAGAKEAAAVLTQALAKETDPPAQTGLSRALAALAPCLDAASAKEAATALTQALGKATNPYTLEPLAEGVAAVAPHLNAPEAAAASRQAAAILTQALGKGATFQDPRAPEALVEVLAALAPHLDAPSAKEAAVALTQALGQTAFPIAHKDAVSGALSAVAARLDPAGAKEVAATLTQALGKPMISDTPKALARVLEVVVARLDAPAAAATRREAVAVLTQALGKMPAHQAWRLVEALDAVAAHLDAPEATAAWRQAAAALTQALGKETQPLTLTSLAGSLATLAPHLDEADPRKAMAALTQALGQEMNDDRGKALAEALDAVGRRLDVVTQRRDAEGSKAAAAALLRARSRALSGGVNNPITFKQQALSDGFVTVLSHEPSARREQRLRGLTGAVGLGASSKSLLPALLLAPSWIDPDPEPLPPQTLVELLKHPLCVGQPRRAVLDQLQRHYRRTFTDQWDFVRFAEEKRLGLDLTTPQRPMLPVAND
jgi:hypothetical protein